MSEENGTGCERRRRRRHPIRFANFAGAAGGRASASGRKLITRSVLSPSVCLKLRKSRGEFSTASFPPSPTSRRWNEWPPAMRGEGSEAVVGFGRANFAWPIEISGRAACFCVCLTDDRHFEGHRVGGALSPGLIPEPPSSSRHYRLRHRSITRPRPRRSCKTGKKRAADNEEESRALPPSSLPSWRGTHLAAAPPSLRSPRGTRETERLEVAGERPGRRDRREERGGRGRTKMHLTAEICRRAKSLECLRPSPTRGRPSFVHSRCSCQNDR